MPPWLRLAGLALVAVPLLLLWESPDLLTFRPVGGTFPPPPSRRALPNAERCVVIGTVPEGVDIALATTPPARTHVRWWCDDDRVYWS